MSEHERIHEDAERQADDLERRGEELDEEIRETRQEWESKKGDVQVPGAQPDDAAEERDRADEDGPPKEAEITPGD
jgi:chromosome segregation ATPase